MSKARLWRCEVCGYIHEGVEPPALCPVCGAGREVFVEMEHVQSEVPDAASVGAWRCGVCDFVHEGEGPPSVCPVCGAGGDVFHAATPQRDMHAAGGADGPIVIVGAGIAGVVAAQRAREAAPNAAISLVDVDTAPPYYRLNLTRLLAEEVGEGELALHPPRWYEERGIDFVRGEVTSIDSGAGEVALRDGGRLGYSRLVLATGAHAFVPPIPGADRRGVHTLRSLEDAREIIDEAARPARCVCIGGGLLGLETAGALRKRGLAVAVLEGFPWLLPRQLPEVAGRMLERRLGSAGVEVRTGVRVVEIAGDERVREVVLADGHRLPADLVVVSTGIRPNTHLARRAGLDVATGVVVDDRMRTSDPRVFAAGDAAEHRGEVHGIWPIAYAQGAIAGTNAAGGSARYSPLPRSNRLKVSDSDVFSIGVIEGADGSYEVRERAFGDRYARVVSHDGRLVGAVLYGDTSSSGRLAEAIEAGRHVVEIDALLAEALGRGGSEFDNAGERPATGNERERRMASIKGTRTEKNLLKAFAGESQARMRYTYAAKVARKAGLVQIAGIFEETAANEQEHAKVFFKFLEGGPVEITATYPAGIIDDTAGNLLAAADGEKEEWTELYPTFASIAKEEGFPLIAAAFEMIARVEKEHEARYRKLLARVQAETVFKREQAVEWKCNNCGYIHTGTTPPDKCPACQHTRDYFEERARNY